MGTVASINHSHVSEPAGPPAELSLLMTAATDQPTTGQSQPTTDLFAHKALEIRTVRPIPS